MQGLGLKDKRLYTMMENQMATTWTAQWKLLYDPQRGCDHTLSLSHCELISVQISR